MELAGVSTMVGSVAVPALAFILGAMISKMAGLPKISCSDNAKRGKKVY